MVYICKMTWYCQSIMKGSLLEKIFLSGKMMRPLKNLPTSPCPVFQEGCDVWSPSSHSEVLR